jgi:hypothetical protein
LLAAGCSGRNACTQFRLVDATSEATRDVSFPIEQFDRRGSLEWKSGYRQLSLRIPYDRLVGRPPTGWAKRAGGKLLLDIELSPVKYEPRELLRGTDRIQVEAMPEQFGLVEYRFGGPAGIIGRALIPARATDFPGLAFLTCPASGISMPVSCTAHINAPHDLRVKVFVPQEELADTRRFVEGAIRVVSQAENARSCDVDN